jgi:hypothetical protein
MGYLEAANERNTSAKYDKEITFDSWTNNTEVVDGNSITKCACDFKTI